jgi:hypothetical protein
MPWSFWAHRVGEACLPSWYVFVMCRVSAFLHTSLAPGFIIKVKKILESICVNCGKLKADIVSRISRFRLLVSHPTIPIFWGLSPHPMVNPKPAPR